MKANRRPTSRPPGRLHGFTLVELLVVIAILALLMSILAPSLRRARVLAVRAVCGSNMHQNVAGISAYAAGNEGLMPPPDYGDVGVNTYNNHRFRSTRSGYDLREMI